MTTYQSIINYLKEHNNWVAGGTIGRDVGDKTGHKSSNIERRARELVKKGKIQAELRHIEGVNHKVVFYKITQPKILPLTQRRFEIIRDKIQARLI